MKNNLVTKIAFAGASLLVATNSALGFWWGSPTNSGNVPSTNFPSGEGDRTGDADSIYASADLAAAGPATMAAYTYVDNNLVNGSTATSNVSYVSTGAEAYGPDTWINEWTPPIPGDDNIDAKAEGTYASQYAYTQMAAYYEC